MASLVLGGAGALIGASIAGPAGAWKGFMIGSAIGSYIDQANQPVPDIGKLSDLRYSGSSYGANIPRLWGRGRIAGNVIWVATDANGNHLRQHKKKSGGGKGVGGGGGATYWYSATFAVAFIQGTLFMPDGTQADGGDLVHRNPVLKKLWADDKLVYDADASSNTVTPAFYAGTESQAPDATIVAAMGVASGDAPAYRGLCYIVLNDMDLRKFSNHIPNWSAEIETDEVTVGDVFSDLARMAGVLPAQLDVTAGTDVVTGFTELNQATPQSSMQSLLTAYAYDAVEVDGVLRLIKRGGASLATIPAQDLGMSAQSDTPKFVRTRKQEVEQPGKVTVQFLDVGNSFQQGSESAVWPVNPSPNTKTLYLPLALTSSQARGIAEQDLDIERTEVETIQLVLGPKYHKYAVGDVLTIPLDTGNARVRFTEMRMAPLGEIRVASVLDSDAVITQAATGGDDPDPPGTYEPVPAVFDAWSGTELIDEHQSSAGFYVCAAPDPAVPGEWGGGVVWYSLDGGTSWIEGPVVSGISTFGSAVSTLSDSGAVPNAYDDANDVDIDLSVMEGELESATDAQIAGGANHALVGDEILGFGTPTLTAPFEYTLSHLLRGERGSDMSSHSDPERFVVLTEDIVRVNVTDDYVGETVKVKVLTEFQDLSDVTAVDVVIAARTPTEVDNLVATAIFPVVLDTPVQLVAETNATATETTIDVSANVSAKARVATLHVYGGHETPDGDEPLVEWRKNGSDSWKPLFKSQASGSGDNVKTTAEVQVSLHTDKTFRLRISPAFSSGVEVHLVGYFG